MWPFQYYFRVSVQDDFKAILSTIGLQTDDNAKVLLIGLATKENLRHAICIEPEDGPLDANDLKSVEERTVAILEADPRSSMTISSTRHHNRQQNALFLHCRAKAIAEAIQESGKFEGLTFFVSDSAPLAGYEIHTCVGIPSEALDSVPRFENPTRGDHYGRHIEESFAQAVINTCLFNADRALRLPYPGEDFRVLGNRVDIVRSSAERFVSNITFSLAGLPNDLFEFVIEFSSLTYESSTAKGHLTVTNSDNLANKLKVTFQNAVGLNETRSIRKLLELTDETMTLLTDGHRVYGLGECTSAPNVASITVEKHAEWSLSINDTQLMKVSYEHATLPKQILDKNFFEDVARRRVGAGDVERIWRILQCALDSGHGTTIVVSEDPTSEMERLGKEALATKPEYLNHKDVARLGRIDGAVFLGQDGRCYATGVILDGIADGHGDRSRGARYNSAVRYQRTASVGTLVIVISDDGTVDLIPKLMPQVSRKAVEDAVHAFCEFSGAEDNNGEEWAKRYDQVNKLAFYLNEEQCIRVNEAYNREMDSRWASGVAVLSSPPLQPNPDMNESFFFRGLTHLPSRTTPDTESR